MTAANTLYYGDCLAVMEEMDAESVDLIYLDPPFNSNADYHAIYRDETGRPLPDQVEAFGDMWYLDAARERAVSGLPVMMRRYGLDDGVAELWRLWANALRKLNPSLLAYLSYMTERLVAMRRLLKPDGSVYLHCDPTASHYLKMVMDAVFGHQNFRNEIIWRRTGAHGGAKRWGPIHDTLLFYTKSETYEWQRIHQGYDDSYVRNYYRFEDRRGRFRYVTLTGQGVTSGDSGRPWRGVDPTGSGRHWAVPSAALRKAFPNLDLRSLSTQEKLDLLDQAGLVYWPPHGSVPQQKRYLDESPGVPLQDIIYDIRPIGAHAKERLGYATQKPVALLERVISASSKEGDLVLDPFCGCATTIEAAHRLGRRWIGIDIAIHAVKRVARVRLGDRLGLREGIEYDIQGMPRNVEGAKDLWRRDPYHFQKWAVEQVDGFVTTRRAADGGVDGRLYFALPDEPDLQSMVIQVDGGANVPISKLRDLHGAMEAQQARMAGFIVLEPLGERKRRNFEQYMAQAGDLDVLGTKYPRMQLLDVAEIIAGAGFQTPTPVGRGVRQPVIPGIGG